ncbi:MAG: hypothetical protein KDK78_01355, partial [Chlamydiia bacterium]|nr:hypothetical protein [Chlamydiia bacterium]
MSAIGEGYALINTLVQHADGAPPPPLTDEKVDQIRAVLLHPELKLQDGATVRQLGKTLRKCKWNPDSRHDKSPFHLLQALIGLRASACSKNQPCAHRAQGLLSALERL